ncbi:MAG: hypothetical protein NTY68_00485 [Candidatus Micrarchaeota archaeon]|nr:hypothetical protein [Candidatus Micrarchaeota archaeon]
MSSPQKLNQGKVSDSANGAKANPLKSKEPLADTYSEKRFGQIVSSIRNINCIDEYSGLVLLASIKKIKESSKDPRKDMDTLQIIFSSVECETDSKARFYVNFYNALLKKSGADQRYISIELFEVLIDAIKVIESHASGDALFDSRDVLVDIASNPNFQPYLITVSGEISYRTSGYGVYLGLRALESAISNPRFDSSWLYGDFAPTLGDFADELNRYRLGKKKFEYFDGACHRISTLLFAFDRKAFEAMLDFIDV